MLLTAKINLTWQNNLHSTAYSWQIANCQVAIMEYIVLFFSVKILGLCKISAGLFNYFEAYKRLLLSSYLDILIIKQMHIIICIDYDLMGNSALLCWTKSLGCQIFSICKAFNSSQQLRIWTKFYQKNGALNNLETVVNNCLLEEAHFLKITF